MTDEDRILNLERQTTELVGKVGELTGELRGQTKQLLNLVGRHDLLLHGDEKDVPGLRAQVLDLLGWKKRITFRLRAIYTAIVGGIAASAWDVFKHKLGW